MAYQIEQSDNYLGNDRWEWSAWIEADPIELDEIRSVTWVLHPTFNPSRIEMADRQNKFKIDRSGWGTFMLRAELTFKNDLGMKTLRKMLQLYYPAETKLAPTNKNQPTTNPTGNIAGTVFLSYSSEDESEARAVSKAMREIGARVLDANSVSAGLPLDAAIRNMIRKSSAVVRIVGSDYVSPYVLSESMMAQLEGKPVYTVLARGNRLPEGLPHDAQLMKIAALDADSLKTELSAMLGELKGKA